MPRDNKINQDHSKEPDYIYFIFILLLSFYDIYVHHLVGMDLTLFQSYG